MTEFRSDFLRILDERGYIHQCSDAAGLDEAASAGALSAYIGYDCTAPSLHVGNLISIMMLRHLQQCGHRPIVLIGGGTTRVGDPSGRDASRQLLNDAQIDANIGGIGSVFSKFIAFGDGPADAVMVNNRDWLDELGYIDFLRDFGRHFSINRMLTFDSVRLRLKREQPLSFLEFNYMILQAYDFLRLNRTRDCRLQMGGSDQWGNIINGIDLVRRVGGRSVYGLTTALLTTSSGAKMGKSAGGAVWLNEDMLSPYDYWQYWRNTEDADVGRFLKLFTELPLDEIARLEALEGRELNDAKKTLATEATALAHGRDAARAQERTAAETFEQGGASPGLPAFTVAQSDIAEGMGLLSVIVLARMASSNGEARRLVRGGGVRVNGAVVNDERLALTEADITPEGHIKISVGRKRHALLKTAHTDGHLD